LKSIPCRKPETAARIGPQTSSVDPRIDGGFKDYDGAGSQRLADRLAGPTQGGQVRLAVGVDRRGDGHDEEIRRGKRLGVGGEGDRGGVQIVGVDLPRIIAAALQSGDPSLVDVEADRAGKRPGEGEGDRQADIPQTDDRYPFVHPVSFLGSPAGRRRASPRRARALRNRARQVNPWRSVGAAGSAARFIPLRGCVRVERVGRLTRLSAGSPAGAPAYPSAWSVGVGSIPEE